MKFQKFFQFSNKGTLICILFVFFSINFIFAGGQGGQKKVIYLKSQIIEVTVFPDRARITRQGSITLTKGEYQLDLGKFPELMNQDTLQVAGNTGVLLKEVKVKKIRAKQITEKEVADLFKQKRQLQNQLEGLENHEERIEDEESFLEDITKKITGVTEKSSPSDLDPDRWIKMVSFYRSKLKNLDDEAMKIKDNRRKLNENLKNIQWQLGQLEAEKNRIRCQVVANVIIKTAHKLTITFSYIIPGPHWVPVYDIYVDSQQKKMKVMYNAYIKQQTGEDWQNINLKLSTAKPGVGSYHGNLKPWYLKFSRQKLEHELRFSQVKINTSSDMVNTHSVESNEWNHNKFSLVDSEGEMGSVEAGTTSVIFAVKGKTTIKNSKSRHKITLLSPEFPLHFRYSVAPQLKSFAFLKAKAKNHTTYPLLAGESSVFLDNAFITTSWMEMVAADQEFWTYLGVDEGIKVSYRQRAPINQNKGLLKKRNKLVFKRLITINYLKNRPEELVVWDRMPVPSDVSIKVKLDKTKANTGKGKCIVNSKNQVEWLFHPKPGEEIKIPFEFSVEYPRGKTIEGLL